MSASVGLSDREAVIETLTNFALSLDDGDANLLAATITETMVMDVSPLGSIGLGDKPIVGREDVVSHLITAVGIGMDTTHHVSNFRIRFDGDKAEVGCYALAQHFRAGHGPPADHGDYFLMGNRWTVSLVKQTGEWRIQNFILTPAWTVGDIGVMKRA